MKILVVDDSKIHQDAAREQLGNHDLTVVGTYDEGHRLISAVFEAVLVDLMLPASDANQAGEGLRFVGQEMPVGIFLALIACQKGVRYVGLLSDLNHHHHPASTCLDDFSGIGFLTVGFKKSATTTLMMGNGLNNTHHINFDAQRRTIKNWLKLLEDLQNPPEPKYLSLDEILKR